LNSPIPISDTGTIPATIASLRAMTALSSGVFSDIIYLYYVGVLLKSVDAASCISRYGGVIGLLWWIPF
jgi:hypothetical protein